MSCITKILSAKGEKEFILSGEIAIEGGGIYKHYEYLIVFVKTGHRCGYVAIPSSHSAYHKKEDYPDYYVHGGITYFGESRFEDLTGGHKCDDKWLGFDAIHGGDIYDIATVEKYFGENEWVRFMKREPNFSFCWDGSVKDYAYMENECKKLIDQLIIEGTQNA